MKPMLNDRARFVLPVIAENMFTASVSLVYSAVTGAISADSLAASQVGNQAMNVISALFCVLTTGSAILAARLTGRGDYKNASMTVEQTVLLSPAFSVAVTALLLLFTPFIMTLLMPGAEEAFLREGTDYFRMILLSVPFLVFSNAASGILRAVGQSRGVLFGTVITNLTQLLGLFLFTRVWPMEVKGVALASVLCRAAGSAYFLIMLFKNHRGFKLMPRRMLRPDAATIKRIFRVGLPACVDGLAVQTAYLVINSMMVGMGGINAQVAGVLSSVLLFTGITQGIGSAVSTTIVGQTVGAGDIQGARVHMRKTLLYCEGVSMLLCLIALLLPHAGAGLFTRNEAIRSAASAFMWIQIPYCIAAVGVNVCEPALRVGGDVRFAMLSISLCVLLIRLPLTYLLCVRLGMGVRGVYYANVLSLGTRFVLSYIRINGNKWGKTEL